jgi:hypothetical protein
VIAWDKTKLTDANPLTFFDQVYASYLQAEQAIGNTIEQHYAIGGHTLRLCFAGTALIPIITRALEHLALNDNAPQVELTVCLWDSASSGVQFPASPWEFEDARHRGGIIQISTGDCYIFVSAEAGLSIAFHQPSRLAVVWTRSASKIPSYEWAAPLRPLLHVWLRQWGHHLAHAGAIGTSRGGVLLVGSNGSGKSSTTLLCVGAGLQYGGDDFCSVTPRGAPQMYSLYNTARVNVQFAQKIPSVLNLTRYAEVDDQGKAILFLQQYFPQQITRNFPIRAILATRVTGQAETRLRPITPGIALKALAPSTVFQLPDGRSEDFQAMAELVRQVPCYQLELGTELERIPELIMKELLQ